MSRAPKKSNPEKVVQVVSGGVPEPPKKVKKEVDASLPKEKKEKKEKVKKEVESPLPKDKKVKEGSDVPNMKKSNDMVVVSEVKTNESDVVSDSPMVSEFNALLTQVQMVTLQLSGIKNAIKTLEKKTVRDLKLANKSKKKSKGVRKPSGFVKPALISNELANFLNQPYGTELARTEVTKVINAYIRANSLQDPTNGRKILPDKKLTELLNVKKEDELTYFNLQRYMSPHFAKASASIVNAVNEVKV
uniref:DM2 domain-containing protein n=1 Tax=viral metagenome TaxID=1070528 RepID=A0A6C0JV51_9ZZZZ